MLSLDIDIEAPWPPETDWADLAEAAVEAIAEVAPELDNPRLTASVLSLKAACPVASPCASASATDRSLAPQMSHCRLWAAAIAIGDRRRCAHTSPVGCGGNLERALHAMGVWRWGAGGARRARVASLSRMQSMLGPLPSAPYAPLHLVGNDAGTRGGGGWGG